MVTARSCSYSKRLSCMFCQSASYCKRKCDLAYCFTPDFETENTFHSCVIFKIESKPNTQTSSLYLFMIIQDCLSVTVPLIVGFLWEYFIIYHVWLMGTIYWPKCWAWKSQHHRLIFLKEQQRTFRTSGTIHYPREPTTQFQDNYKLKHNCLSPVHQLTFFLLEKEVMSSKEDHNMFYNQLLIVQHVMLREV